MVTMGSVMALLVAGAFVPLFVAIDHLHDANVAARRSQAVLICAGRIERLVSSMDEETRELVLTGNQQFSRAYEANRTAVPGEEARLERLAARGGAAQSRSAQQIVRAENAYLHDQLTPLMNAARGDPDTARAMVDGGQGLRRLSALQDQLVGYENAQRVVAAATGRHAENTTRTAVISAAVPAAGVLLAMLLFVAHLTRVMVRPVRHAVDVAGRLAKGDLAVRMPETSPGELGRLEHRFNTMVESLEMSRAKLHEVAEEQSALRRVATLVARGVSPAEVFDAVAEEVGHVLHGDHTQIIRFEPDDTARTVGYWNNPEAPKVMPPLGGRWAIEDDSVTATVRNTERPARMENYEHATSAIGVWAHATGVQSAVGCPVKVEGRVWGALVINSLESEPLPAVTEARMQQFIELVGTAIANAQSRSDLLASRARVVAAADESRRRIERDLHDGAQQRLVTLALKLRTIQSTVGRGRDRLKGQLAEIIDDLSGILDDLQEVSRGIVPPILTRSGLGPALRSLARRSSIPVKIHDHHQGRLPEPVEVGIYYTVCEALTNVVKHAMASEALIDLTVEDQTVRLSVRDDGRGGADLGRGSGLIGLKDRIEALSGTLRVVSPPGSGTALLVEMPVEPPQSGHDTAPPHRLG
jgi:signal transduction histidine kinase